MKTNAKGWKLILGLMIVSTISLLVSGCSGNKPATVDSSAKQPYKIGAVVDISGNSSSLGVPERDTLLMMAEKINASGGIQGHPLELTILDNKSDETEAVLAAKNLIEEKVLAVLGCSASGTSMA